MLKKSLKMKKDISKEKDKKGLQKIGYYLSLAFYDPYFRIFFITLVLKLSLFLYLIGLPFNSFFPSFGFILLPLSLSMILNNKQFKLLFLLFVNIIFSIIFFSNSIYFKYFGDFISIYDFHQAHQLTTVLDVVANLIGIEILFLFDLIFIPFLGLKFNNITSPDKIKSALILSILSLYFIFNPMILNKELQKRFIRGIYFSSDFVRDFGIINYQITDTYNYLLAKTKKQITQSDIALVKKWFEEKNSHNQKNYMTAIGKGLNLIIIQVESLQNFVIGKSVNGKEITPNLNRLAESGIYFRNIYDQTAAGNTSDSIFLSNSSLFPTSKGAICYLYFQNCFDTLPKILKNFGYKTAIMHALDKTYWNMSKFSHNLGFEYHFFEDKYEITEKLGGFLKGLSDREFFRQSVDKLKNLKSPFYALLITLSSHAPYAHITEDMVNFPLNGLKDEIIGYYIRAIHYTDSAIGDFLERLSENKMLENTIIVVFGDHRSRLPEKEIRKIGINDMSELRKIPIIISLPGKRIGKIKDTIGGHIDITPTILNILGIDASDRFFMGKDLMDDNSFVIFRNGSFISNDPAMNELQAKRQLMISDLIIEKDMIPILRNGKCE